MALEKVSCTTTVPDSSSHFMEVPMELLLSIISRTKHPGPLISANKFLFSVFQQWKQDPSHVADYMVYNGLYWHRAQSHALFTNSELPTQLSIVKLLMKRLRWIAGPMCWGVVNGCVDVVREGLEMCGKHNDEWEFVLRTDSYLRCAPVHVACRQGFYRVVKLLLEHDGPAVVEAEDMWSHQTPLHFASAAGHLEIVKALLAKEYHVNINAKNGDDETALSLACQHGHVHIASFLLDHGASFGDDKAMFLQLACESGKLDVLNLLLERGLYVNDAYDAVSHQSLLHFACQSKKSSPDVVEWLLKIDSALVNARDVDQMSAMHYASDCGNAKVVQTLLSCGGDPNLVEQSMGFTPLLFACTCDRVETVRTLLLHGVDVHCFDNVGLQAIHHACMNGHVDVVDMLLQHGIPVNSLDRYGLTPLHFACAKGHIHVVKLLLRNGADLSLATSWGLQPVHIARRCGRRSIANLLLKYRQGSNMKCLEADEDGTESDPDSKKDDGLLGLCSKSHYINLTRIDTLLAEGADVNVGDDILMTPLHIACAYGNKEVAKRLWENGARIDLKDKDGLTPLHHACLSNQDHVVEFLLGFAGNLDKAGIADMLIASYEADTRFPLSFASNDVDHEPAFIHYATEVGHGTTKLLLESDVDVNTSDADGNTALHHACLEDDEQLAQLLLNHGANVNKQNNDGMTPLHFACEYPNIDMVELLFKHGGDFTIKDGSGRTPLKCLPLHHL